MFCPGPQFQKINIKNNKLIQIQPIVKNKQNNIQHSYNTQNNTSNIIHNFLLQMLHQLNKQISKYQSSTNNNMQLNQYSFSQIHEHSNANCNDSFQKWLSQILCSNSLQNQKFTKSKKLENQLLLKQIFQELHNHQIKQEQTTISKSKGSKKGTISHKFKKIKDKVKVDQKSGKVDKNKKIRRKKAELHCQWECPACNRKYTQRSSLRKHIKHIHKQSYDLYVKQIKLPAWAYQSKGRPKILQQKVCKKPQL